MYEDLCWRVTAAGRRSHRAAGVPPRCPCLDTLEKSSKLRMQKQDEKKGTSPVLTALAGTACGGMMNAPVNVFHDFIALPEG